MVESRIQEMLKNKFNKNLNDCSDKELFDVLLSFTKDEIKKVPCNSGHKKLYYISAEFLLGKLLSNNLINLGLFDEVSDMLKKYGKSLSKIEEMELEPSLGNGGLGRLAACFLDSIATLGLNGDGIGLNYHFGLFKQLFKNHKQKEEKNPWITDQTWLNKTNTSFKVQFKNFTAVSRLYNLDIVGYKSGTNKLHLFDIETVDETIVKAGINFDKKDIQKNLTLFLYPDDSDKSGNLLRIYQQYFMVSNAAQLIIKECEDKGYDLKDMDAHVVIQINDTHPTMVIPEMIRLLVKKGIFMNEAIRIVRNMCAYTNHTILSEALEKWPLEYLKEVVPQLIPIIKRLDRKVRWKYKNPKVAIIDKNKKVHMAHIDIHYGFSVNGVANLHTNILETQELREFYNIYPEKFNNKTNGITFRRWLLHANRDLTSFIDSLIGTDYKKDADKLNDLQKFIDDKRILDDLIKIKKKAKVELKNYIKSIENISIDENSIFDIQIKRLHEYKRQQMNALYVIYKYLKIKKGNKPSTPITVIFGAKAAPAYTIAKDIIHLILCLQELINNDPDVSPYLKVVMVENYNVTYAEKLIPACDLSEQISLASKEASGTGNMKFMLNGAVTIGTMDGANVEIYDLVGKDNIYIFGESSESVILHYLNKDYNAYEYYSGDIIIKTCVDFIVSDLMMNIGDRECLKRVYNELINKDWFMTLLDFEDYVKTKEKAFSDYESTEEWAKKMLINISKAGYFSSDRSIKQYNDDIWHLSSSLYKSDI